MTTAPKDTSSSSHSTNKKVGNMSVFATVSNKDDNANSINIASNHTEATPLEHDAIKNNDTIYTYIPATLVATINRDTLDDTVINQSDILKTLPYPHVYTTQFIMHYLANQVAEATPEPEIAVAVVGAAIDEQKQVSDGLSVPSASAKLKVEYSSTKVSPSPASRQTDQQLTNELLPQTSNQKADTEATPDSSVTDTDVTDTGVTNTGVTNTDIADKDTINEDNSELEEIPIACPTATDNLVKTLKVEEKVTSDIDDDEALRIEKEAKLEAYKQFVAEQKSQVEIDYASIRVNIEANALPSRMYFIMNALSAIIASYGLVINSAAVVIGAMLVAMMLGPISGVALATIDYRIPFLRKSLMTVFAGGSMVVTIGFIIGWLHKSQPLTNEILSRTQPTSMDLMIALAGGTAGAYAMISPHLSVAVVGVAVATALVPPLAASGILFANGESSLGFGALLLAITNIIAIQFTNALVLWFTGFRRLTNDDYKSGTYVAFFRRNAITLLLLAGIGLYLSINLNSIAGKQRFENEAKDTIADYFIEQGNVLTATQFIRHNDYQTIRAVIRGETRPSSFDAQHLEREINTRIINSDTNALPVQLQLRYLPVVVIESTPRVTEKINKTDGVILSTE